MASRRVRDPRERLAERYVITESGCWQFTGFLNWAGYGIFTLNGVKHPAHRAAYIILVGPVPKGLDLDHLCRNRACINPAHLEPVTRSENLRRGEAGGWQRNKTHCVNGHAFTQENTYIRPDGTGRECRTCQAAAHERYRARKANAA